jgi:hypothetical protein
MRFPLEITQEVGYFLVFAAIWPITTHLVGSDMLIRRASDIIGIGAIMQAGSRGAHVCLGEARLDEVYVY